MATDNKQALVSLEWLQGFITGALRRVGLPEAGQVAMLMAQADLAVLVGDIGIEALVS